MLNSKLYVLYSVSVPKTGIEPARVAPHAPQACASTNFATSAFLLTFIKDHTRFARPAPLAGFRPALAGLNLPPPKADQPIAEAEL